MKPELNTFKSLAKKHKLVPTFLELPADIDTPVTIYQKISNLNPYSVLLESVEGGEKFARYSFISSSYHIKFECNKGSVRVTPYQGKSKVFVSSQPLQDLKKIMNDLNPASSSELPYFCGGAVGMVAYEMARHFEKLPSTLGDDIELPDALFLLTNEAVVFDHWKHRMFLIKWNLIENPDDDKAVKSYRAAKRALGALASKIQKPLPGSKRPKHSARKP